MSGEDYLWEEYLIAILFWCDSDFFFSKQEDIVTKEEKDIFFEEGRGAFTFGEDVEHQESPFLKAIREVKKGEEEKVNP